MSGKITIREVAAAAGVSLGTASQALSGHGGVRAQTAQKVRDAAKKLGYHRMTAAAVLSSRAHRHPETVNNQPVAFLYAVPEGWFLPERNYEYGIKAAEKSLQELGYDLICHNLATTQNHRVLSRQLFSRGISGAIVGSVYTPIMTDGFDWSLFPTVLCERLPEEWPGHIVRTGHFDMARYLISEALRRGYRRIAFCRGNHEPIRDDDMAALGGFLAEKRRTGRKAKLFLFEGRLKDIVGKVKWVQQVQADVVIGFNGAEYAELLASGSRIPEEIGFGCFALSPSDVLKGTISGFDEPYAQRSIEAVNLLDQLIRFRAPVLPEHPVDMIIHPKFHEGHTLPNIPCRKK